ncbi:MAG: cytochrome c3 family protein [Deltaproteobacteria bacterium]|nr:cytochrome c3 family protein [Deltaproteobacteria bacterium]
MIFLLFFLFSPSAVFAEEGAPLCLSCHDVVDPQVDVGVLARSVHGGFDCTACHRDVTAVPHETKPNRVDCSVCHGDIAGEHAGGVHRIGKKKEVSYLTTCTACHGNHDILPKSDFQSPVSRTKIPETCGKCHEGVLRHFVESAHGKLWKKGDERGPVCITCHKAHSIQRIASKKFRVELPDECGKCHEDKAPSYRDTFHGQATSIGYMTAAKCSDCHTAHMNLPASDPDSTVNPANLMETCGVCHQGINANFVEYDPHSNPHDKGKSPLLYYASQFMFWLLALVFGFFGLHTFLWFQRSVTALIRGEVRRKWETDRYIIRFNTAQRLTHLMIVVSFLGLAATGIPLKYHYAEWAKPLIVLFGGVEVSRYFHRVCAVLTGLYVLFHAGYLFQRLVREGKWPRLFRPDTILPRWKDAVDLWRNFRWFFYLGERPGIGRWAYWEKFDYFAIFWGIPVIGLSGLILWFPEFFTRFLPGVFLNLAMIIHGEEALLALGFIFIFHFFHNHLRPENFPIDTVIFTGRLPLDRFKEERPEVYEELVRDGKLDKLLVGPPSERMQRAANIFGYSALGIGMILAICIFVAFFSTYPG